MLTELSLHLRDTAGHRLMVVAHTDDLDHSIQQTLVCGHDGRGKLDRPLFAIDMRTVA